MISRNDDPSSSPTAIVGVTFAILVVVTVLLLQAYFARVQDEELASKLQGVASTELEQMRAKERSRVGEYRWVDRETGTVAIPIDRAMELVVAELGENGSRRNSIR